MPRLSFLLLSLFLLGIVKITEGSGKAVLSIDGGGVRGIIPAVMLLRLEQALQEASNNTNATIVDYFDVVAGTSTGGLITIMLTAPDSNNLPLFTAKEVVDFYMTKSQEIFSQKTSLAASRRQASEKDVELLFPNLASYFEKPPLDENRGSILQWLIDQLIKIINGWDWKQVFQVIQYLADKLFGGAKYSPKNLDQILQDFLNDLTLNQTLKPVVISSFDIVQNKPAMFKTSQAKDDSTKNALLRDLGRATSAAPTYFPPKRFTVDGTQYNVVDGGLAANNPALFGLIEAENLKGGDSSKATISDDNMVFSLGCGRAVESYSVPDVDNWTPLSWMMLVKNDELKTPLVNMLMDAHSEMVDRSLSLIFNDETKRSNYLRIQATLSDDLTSLDDGSPDHMNQLQQYAYKLLQEPMTRLNVVTGDHAPAPGNITNEQAIIRLAKTLVSNK